MYMEPLSLKEYRNNIGSAFDRADQGEIIKIRRKGNIYTLQCLGHDFGNEFTPELQRKLAEAEERRKEGDIITIRNKEELDTYLGSL